MKEYNTSNSVSLFVNFVVFVVTSMSTSHQLSDVIFFCSVSSVFSGPCHLELYTLLRFLIMIEHIQVIEHYKLAW